MESTPTITDIPIRKVLPNPPVDTTFRVSAIKATVVNPKAVRPGSSTGYDHIKKLIENESNSILHGTDFSAGGTREFIPSDNGFVQSAIHAYNHHHNLVIRPDDVWIALVIQFSRYVDRHSEEFRDKFVDFKDKKELTVYTEEIFDFDDCVEQMMGKIHENIQDKSIRDWLLPNFSTTTKDDYLTAGVVLMATMKAYFKYRFRSLCGIPEVTLCGTVEDWEKIATRIKKFREYNLPKWVDMLDPILKQFVQAKKGNYVDQDFWQRIYNFRYPNGSGDAYISGWITAFCVFNTEGEWQEDYIDPGSIPVGFVEVDVKLIYPDGSEVDSVLTAGHLGKWILDDKCTLQPKIGWVVSVKNEEQTEKANSAH